jgi:hypothetical protein
MRDPNVAFMQMRQQMSSHHSCSASRRRSPNLPEKALSLRRCSTIDESAELSVHYIQRFSRHPRVYVRHARKAKILRSIKDRDAWRTTKHIIATISTIARVSATIFFIDPPPTQSAYKQIVRLCARRYAQHSRIVALCFLGNSSRQRNSPNHSVE